MLLGLNLKNFAIIDDLAVSFGGGLNIITGETGAGKSIIVDAVNIILGDRASPDIIKSGAKEARIEALFDIGGNEPLRLRLESLGFDAGGGELVIRRTVSPSGRGRIFINGALATGAILALVAEGLVDIFSQHEHQTLLKEENHLRLLDEFGALTGMVQDFSELYQNLRAARRELAELVRRQKEGIEKEEFLNFQLSEIDSAALEPDEDESLEVERKKLANAEALHSVAESGVAILYENERSVLGALRRLSDELGDAAEIDAALLEVARIIDKSIVELEEGAFTLRDYASEIRFNPARLNDIEARLQEIKRLKRKYGARVADVIARRDHIAQELGAIASSDDAHAALSAEVALLESGLDAAAGKISEKRRAAAQTLSATVERELAGVGIKGGRLAVEFEGRAIASTGGDRALFLFSANPDEKPKALQKIASGGELSRIMLILKDALSKIDGGAVLIFDEADSGIGGAVAEAVGRKIKKLSASHQVICITHLAQVAKFADAHFRVAKTFRDGKTDVEVRELAGEERVGEIARMLSGMKITEKTLDAAREMLRDP